MPEAAAALKVRPFRVAVTQWHATRDMASNLEKAKKCIYEAGRQNADLVVLPENGLFLGTNAEMRLAALRVDGSEIAALRAAAREAHTTVVLGGFKRQDAAGKIFNTALVIGESGDILGGYDKIHLFDAAVDGQQFDASSVETRGNSPAILLVKGVKIGLTICYDVRFPELFRTLALAGAEIILVPAAFTYTTGQAHWDVLLRARAIENGTFIVAPATIRGANESDAFQTYGHASIVDPWGKILVDLGEAACVCTVVQLDLERVSQVRKMLPVLRGVQLETSKKMPIVIGADALSASTADLVM